MDKHLFSKILDHYCTDWKIGVKNYDGRNKLVIEEATDGYPIVLAVNQQETYCEKCKKTCTHKRTYRRITRETQKRKSVWLIRCSCKEEWRSVRTKMFIKD